MKRITRLEALLLASLAGLFGLSRASGQSVPESFSPANAEDDEIVVLSPFVVDASDSEDNYIATRSTSATRLNTELKDVAASVDVLTATFLNDVGANDMFESMKYVANVEVYTGRSGEDEANNTQWFAAPYISRGIRSTDVRINFFPTPVVPIDRYNTDSLTFMRGPNAILYGVGDPAGIVGAATKRAMLGKDLYSIRYVTNDSGTQRGEIDISKVLIEDKLAVRMAGVYSNTETFKTPAPTTRNAVFATVTYKPLDRTTITVNLEDGVYNRVHDQGLVTSDAYTPWVRAGRPTVNWKTGAVTYADGSIVSRPAGKGRYNTGGTPDGLANPGTGRRLIYVEGTPFNAATPAIMDWAGLGRGADWTDLSIPNGTDRGKLSGIGFNESTNTITLPDGTSWKVDLKANAFGSLRQNDNDYDSQTVMIEQSLLHDRIWGNLDLELAWNKFTYNFLFDNYGTSSRVEVDVNEFLPNGAANPNVGRPYIDTGNGNVNREKHILESRRATLAYSVDLDRRKLIGNIGLGKYSAMGLYESIRDDGWWIFSRYADTSAMSASYVNGSGQTVAVNHNASWNDGSNYLIRRYYLEPGKSSYRHNGPREFTVDGKHYVETNGVITNTLNDTIAIREVPADFDPRRRFTDTESKVFALQGYWWETDQGYYRLRGMYGKRYDERLNGAMIDFALSRDPVTRAHDVVVNDFGTIERAGRWNTAVTPVKSATETYNIIVQPLRAVSLFYNYSDVFKASAGAGEDIRMKDPVAAYGDTNDYGARFDLLGGRVSATVTYFETFVSNTSEDISGLKTRFNQIWDTIETVAPGQGIDERFSATRLIGYRDDGTEGLEVALAANITPNWRMRLAASSQETTIAKRNDELVPYMEQHSALWNTHADVAIVWPNTNELPPDLDGDGVREVSDAVGNLVQSISDRRAIVGQRPNDQRKYKVSLTTNYGFSTGPLDGFRVGGGVRWSSENILGYARDAAGRNLDTSRPFEGDQLFDTDLTIGYSRRFADGRYKWDIQLNVYNVLDDKGTEGKEAVDRGNGEPLVVRSFFKAPRSFQLTNTFSF